MAQSFTLQQIELSQPHIRPWVDADGMGLYPRFRWLRLNMDNYAPLRFLPEIAPLASFEFKFEASWGYPSDWSCSYYWDEPVIVGSAPLPANARNAGPGRFNFNIGYQF